MESTSELSASLEDYLETIFLLIQEGRVARVKDIAARMEVQMPSVTGALRTLASKELVHHDPYSYITLTPHGEALAREVLRRHQVLTDFLVEFLGLEAEAAERNACRLEHAIEPSVLDRLVDFVEFAEQCPRTGAKWIRGKAHVCREGRHLVHCEECIEGCLAEVRAARAAAQGSPGRLSLLDVEPGQRVNVAWIEADERLAAKCQEHGLEPGALLEVESIDPEGAVDIKVRGYRLSLPPGEAAAIVVEPPLVTKGQLRR